MNLNKKILITILLIILFLSINTIVFGKYIISTESKEVANIDINTYNLTVNDFKTYGKADIYINNIKIGNGVSSFNNIYNKGTCYEIKNIVANPGYTFKGISGGELSGTINGNTPLILEFTTNNYNISYTLNGGTISGNKTSYTVETNNFTLPTPTRTGYIFDGWTGSNGTTKQKTVTINKGTTGNLSYTANWTGISYSVKFNSNGGSGTMSNQTGFVYGTAKSLTSNSFTRTGYTFNGWNTKSDGTGITYSNNGNMTNGTTTSGGVVNLYAQWKINQYTVDVNPIIDGVSYGNGKSGYTFNVYLNGTLKASNVIDFCQSVNYGTSVRVVANNASGHAKENADTTQTVGTSGLIFNPKWFKYTPISLKSYHEMYGQTDNSVSYSFNTANGIYTVTQKANTAGWGTGSLCDNTGVTTSWGGTYVMHFEIYLNKSAKLLVDPNSRPITGNWAEWNDFYQSVVFEVDGIKTTYKISEHNVGPQSVNGVTIYSMIEKTINKTLSANRWYSINIYVPNNAPYNASKVNVKNFSGFGLDLSSCSSNVTYQVRNIYSYNK